MPVDKRVEKQVVKQGVKQAAKHVAKPVEQPIEKAADGDAAFKTTSPAVVRAIHVVDLLARFSGGLSLADLARETGYPKSSLHGLCETLVQLRLARRLADGNLHLGPHVMSWANAFVSQSDLPQEFRAAWEEAGVFPEETITLSVLDGKDIMYLACHHGDRPLGITFRIGMRLPAPFTATGKAILSTLAPMQLQELFRESWPEPLTRASVDNIDALGDELRMSRSKGYSIDNGQMRDGMICFGAPVFDSTGTQAVAGVAVSFLATEIDDEAAAKIGVGIRTLADCLSSRLGASR